MQRFIFLLLFNLFAIPTWATCSNPTANAGAMDWKGSKFQYCDGTSWQDFGGAGGAVNDLSDVSATVPISSSLLLFDGSEWESITLATLKTLLDSGTGGGSGGGGSSASCPAGFAFIPGSANIDSQAKGWCVSKYEMTPHDPSGWNRSYQGYRFDQKGSDATVAAKAGQHSINYISRNEAQTQCSGDLVDANGNTVSNGKLITVELWSKLAQDITDVDENWSGGSVGNGYMSRGHANNSPNNILATAADAFPTTTGMTNAINEYWSRTHKTSNGDLIWDLAGNIYEWFYDLHNTGGQSWYDHNQGAFAFGSIPLEPSQGGYNKVHGTGRIYSGANGATPDNVYAALFSGMFSNQDLAGLWMSRWATYSSSGHQFYYAGFRCIAPAS